MAEVRAALFYDTDRVSLETAMPDDGSPSLTVQSEKDEADINVLVERFGVTGHLPQVVRAPTFADFGDMIFDYRSAIEAIELAQDSFLAMPAKVRSRFDNDPQKFVEFCSDPANLDEMRALGLALPATVVQDSPAADGPST